MKIESRVALAALAALAFQTLTAGAEPVEVRGVTYASWADYHASDAFRLSGDRCGTPAPTLDDLERTPPSDCNGSQTVISSLYNPVDIYEIPVFVHIITTTSGAGNMSDTMVQSQIDILNEDFQALVGTPGEPGTDCAIRFKLATEDENGNPSTGITRTANNNWYNDQFDSGAGGWYYAVLGQDTSRFLNIYTLGAPQGSSSILGYVPGFPWSGIAGAIADRVVIGWRYFGRDSPGSPYNQGRTATHEVGHWAGLYHTFQSGCGSAAACYTSGDLICDTEPEANPRFSCGGSSCGTIDPFRNYMDYTNDTCMNNFTPEQCNRMRCALINYRPAVYDVIDVVAVGDVVSSGQLFTLHQNQPNPFNPRTRITFDLANEGEVALHVLDVNGRVIRDLAEGSFDAGLHEFTWDGLDNEARSVATGVYFYRLDMAGQSLTRRMVLMK